MTYEEAESYINDTPKFTKKNTLENTRMVLDAMGHPERKMKLFMWQVPMEKGPYVHICLLS